MRRRAAAKREKQSDTKFNSRLVGQMISLLMERGKKSTAERIVYNALKIASEKAGNKPPLDVLGKAIDNARPLLEVKARRIGGATYQVPIEVKPDRGVSIALRWIKNYAKAKKGRPMEQRLADEIFDAYKGECSSVKKKEDTHKMAESNKAFSHYKW